jgi:hypothetical protein
VLFAILAFDLLGNAVSMRWPGFFPENNSASRMLGPQLLILAEALCVLAVIWLFQRQRSLFYFQVGDLCAPVEPSWVRIFGRRLRWRLLAPIVCLVSCCLGWWFLSSRHGLAPPVALLSATTIWILFYATQNAISEELIYRNGLLSALQPACGVPLAVILSSCFFGVGHYYGTPYGVTGVALTAIFGFFLAKAMVETKGMFWSCAIHIGADIIMFSALVAGSIKPGGG